MLSIPSWRLLRGKALLHGSTLFAALAPALWLLVRGYEKRWTTDDGFINLRVVHQLMAGHGFVYNAGERTEVVTSPAWVLILWLSGELGCDIETAAWTLSLAFSAIGVFMAALAVARLRESEPASGTVVMPLGMVAYVAIPVAWEYTTSGLENGLGIGFLGTAYYLVARAITATDRGRYLAATFCGFAPLVRPDFALFGGSLVLLLLLSSSTWRTRWRAAVFALLPGLSFQIFRMGYFACLVPNTALAKEAFGQRWEQGYWYLDDMMSSYELTMPLVAAAVCLVVTTLRLRRSEPPALALVPLAMAGAGALHVLYVVRVGGDFMHGRLLLPGLFALLASSAVVHLPITAAELRPRWTNLSPLLWIALLVTAGWGVHCATKLSFRPSEAVVAAGINDERRFYVETSNHPHPTRVRHYKHHIFYEGPLSIRRRIAERCEGGMAALEDKSRLECSRFALPDGTEGVLVDQAADVLLPLQPGSAAPFVLGVMGFRPLGIAGLAVGLRMNVVDGFSLADSLASRIELLQRGRPGHEKLFSTWWFAAKYLAEGVTHDERALVARRVLKCGLVAELQAATHDPMTLRRFLKNMQLSFALHRLRVPSDPHEAERKLCS